MTNPDKAGRGTTYGGRRRSTFARDVPTTKPFYEERLLDFGGVPVQLHAPHEAAAADVHDRALAALFRVPELLPEPLPRLADPLEEAAVHDLGKRLEPEAARDRVAPEGGSVVPGFDERRDPFAHENGPERQAAAEGLGERHEIGHNAHLLEDEEVPGAPEPRLNLVENEHRAHAVGRGARGSRVLFRQRDDSPFAEDRLQEDPGHLRRGGALEGRDVVRGKEDGLAHERLKGLAVRLVARERERSHRAPVKAALEREHPASPGHGEARELHRGFDRLGAAVAEEDARHPGELREALGEKSLRRVVEEIRDVEKAVRLLAERLHEARMPVTERVHGDAGEEVPVDLSLGVDELRALPRARVEGRAFVGAEDVLGIPLLDERRGFRRRLQQGGFLRCPRTAPRRGRPVLR